MATPQASDNPETQRHYAAQLALGASLTATIRTLWPSLLPLDSDNVRRLTDALVALLGPFSESAITLASDHYLNARRDAGITTPLTIVRTPLPPRSKVEASVAWAVEPITNPEIIPAESVADLEAKILARVEAKAQKILADEARAQIVEAVEGDDQALGFARIARPDACAFCLMLAFRTSTRGLAKGESRHYGVYKSRKTAGQMPAGASGINRYHTNCHCTVEPVFDADWKPAPHILAAERLYEEVTGDAERDFLNVFRRAVYAQRKGRETPALPEITTNVTPTANADAMRSLLDRLGESMTRAA